LTFDKETTYSNNYSTNSLNITYTEYSITVLNETSFTNTQLAKLLPVDNSI